MKKKKIIFIGAIDMGNVATNGETMKNQLLLRRFEDIYDEVIAVDANNWRKRPWCFVQILWSLIWNGNVPVVISASSASSKLYDFLYYFPLKQNVNDWVIGGAFPKKIREGEYRLQSLAKLNRIIVEGESMAIELREMGLSNVVHVPNFKPIEFTPNISVKKEGEKYRFVFLSRIHPNKGIQEIVEACKELNLTGYNNQYEIDFYGAFEKGYEPTFHQLTSAYENMHYKGFLNLMDTKGYQILSQYDSMLFPSYWNGEGFPGIVIDAYIAGLPIIASDWNMNKEVIEDGKTGFIIPTHDAHSLALKMKELIDGQADLYQMRCHCAERAQYYDYRNVVTEDLLKNLNLL